MRVAGLFSGIGGFELGLARAGHEATLLCEIWRPAQSVLAERFPQTRLEADIETLDALPDDAEALTAGFPCQDLSQAGRTLGIGGARSGLIGHVFRLLDARPPRRRLSWVVLENVSFMLQLDGGGAMRLLVDAFEARGYRWAYRVVNSLAFLPQRRERVLFVAAREADPADVLLADDAPPYVPVPPPPLNAAANGFYWTEGVRGLGWAPDAVPTLKKGSTLGIASPPAILMPDGRVITPDIRDAERLQGFDSDWTQPAERTDRSSLRWSLIGNAVTVPVAHWLGDRLAAPGVYDRSRDAALPGGARWPRAARFDGDRRLSVQIDAFPVVRPRPPLADFLRHQGKPLSARATKGFLSRAERASLRFPPGFLDALRAHLAAMQADAPLDRPLVGFAAE